jgi:1-deoxy-D-xylulose-5-phosphate reductoisomerase
MVAYQDGTVMANMSKPDMRLPIQYAITYPNREHPLRNAESLEREAAFLP